MSHINIDNLIRQYNPRSNIYMPIIEAIVNSIDAIEDNNNLSAGQGLIEVTFERENSILNESNELSEFINVIVFDNGIGFNHDNTEAFDTLFTEKKISKGGKGFGRIMYKKHFQNIKIESVFFDTKSKTFKKRRFIFGNKNIVNNNKITKTVEDNTWTKLFLKNRKNGNFDKKIETVSKRILENLLPYFIAENYTPPTIVLKDSDGNIIKLNELFKVNEYIKIIKSDEFVLTDSNGNKYNFNIYIFKIYSPKNQKSTINLVANKREVTSTNISEYLPEFEEEFFDKNLNKNFIIKCYILGQYLDDNVNLERMSFAFGKKEKGLLYPFSQKNIEEEVVAIIENEFQSELTSRKEKKIEKVNEYLREHPWFADYKDDIQWNKLPMRPTDEDIENHLHFIKYNSERRVKAEIKNILSNIEEDFEEKINRVFGELDTAKQSELAHYVSLRKVVLDVLAKALEKKDNNKYSTENIVHNIIFPVKKDSEDITYHHHNLWILDERLSFTEYLASDKPIFYNSSDRPDIFCFDKKVAFRGDNIPSNPITIFEFKRPGRDDFTNPSSKDDPYEQLTRYIEEIKQGKLKTPTGRPIRVGENTPFYGFIIADLTGKVKDWLIRKDFDPTPDGEGFFKYHKAYNLYTEFISWDKLLADAKMRNAIFFSKLGI